MEKTKALDALKQAILLEIKGKAFYESVARQSKFEGIRHVFETMADEEKGHIDVLTRQFKSVGRSGKFEPTSLQQSAEDFTQLILTDEIKKNAADAAYEAAALGAAMDMEDKAVKYYGERARATDDPLEKEMYQWLSDWEKTHLNLLANLEKQLQEEIWNDQSFWPF
jgi:rubrerythrin